MTEHIDNLNIDFEADGSLVLEQDCTGNISRVYVHPTQLRYMAEKAGLIETSDPAAQRTIAMLTRRLMVLRGRIEHLSGYMSDCSDTSHANLDYEIGFIDATADIANEFCVDLPATATPVECGPAAKAVQASCAPPTAPTAAVTVQAPQALLI